MTSLDVSSQCLCSNIKFSLVLTDLKVKNKTSNYSIKILKPNGFLTEKERNFTIEELKCDTVNFQFPTGGGIDTLTFIIKNITLNKEMKVTVTHMTYDNPYYIDLTTFTDGNFVFDWLTIGKCQRENLSETLIECDGRKLYQLQLKTDKEHFCHNKIKPFELKDYKE